MNQNLERETHTSQEYSYGYLEAQAEKHGIHLSPSRDQVWSKLEAESRNIEKSPLYKPEDKTDPTMRPVVIFHKAFIKPMLSTASDAFRPTPEDTHQLGRQLLSPEGVTFVISIAQCKTLSPRRTGSPDAVIDFAELEMYSNLATVTSTAREMGMNLRFILLDEGTIFPDTNILGIKKDHIATNRKIVGDFLSRRGVSDLVLVRDLDKSIIGPLNSHFEPLHNERYVTYRDQINTQMAIAASTGSLDAAHKATIEAFVLFDCIPDNELLRAGVDPSIRNIVNSPKDLPNIPAHVLDEVVSLAAHCEAVLSMRADAADAVSPHEIDKYPEHNPLGKISAGITRKDSRISFLPHPTRFNGRTVFPMHGLAAYSDGNFRGFLPYSKTLELPEAEVVYSGENHKPLFVKINSEQDYGH
jgi:hypothetical protein